MITSSSQNSHITVTEHRYNISSRQIQISKGGYKATAHTCESKYVHKRLNNQSIKIVDKYKELSISIADNVQAEAQKLSPET